MPYKYFFQGFEGARQVQSMMIDLPELKFVFADRIIASITTCKGINDYFLRVNHANGHSLPFYRGDDDRVIFVSPESEAFFEYKENEDTVLMDFKEEKILYWERNGKRIFMPRLNDTNVGQ